MSAVLEVEGLVKHFPIAGQRAVVQAVNGISFSVARGETLSLVGESGSGKTTVGRCVLGLIQRTGGAVRFHGAMIDKRHNIRSRDLRGKLQLVFQEPAESLDPRKLRLEYRSCRPWPRASSTWSPRNPDRNGSSRDVRNRMCVNTA